MDCDVLADDVSIADFDRARCARLETQILRPRADDRAVANLVRRTQSDRAFNDGMRLHDRARADFHLRADAGVGSDLHLLAEPRRRIDHRGRMNFHSTPISLKLK